MECLKCVGVKLNRWRSKNGPPTFFCLIRHLVLKLFAISPIRPFVSHVLYFYCAVLKVIKIDDQHTCLNFGIYAGPVMVLELLCTPH